MNTGLYNITLFVTNDIPKSSTPSIIQYEIIESYSNRFHNIRLKYTDGAVSLLNIFMVLL